MAPPDVRRRGGLPSRLALAGLSLVLALGCGEGAFRAWLGASQQEARSDDDWRRRITEMNRTLYRRSQDPALIYEPNPGSSYDMGGWQAAFNQAGVRDDREFEPVPAGRRVAILGDSIAWGEHLALEQTVGRRLEALLPGAEVLNFGVTGYDTAQEAAWYLRGVRPLAPTDVVLVFCLNDLLIMSGPYNAWADEAGARRKEDQDELLERIAPVRAETVEWVMHQRERRARLKLLARARALLVTSTFHRSARYTDEFLVMEGRPEVRARTVEALRRLGAATAQDEARAWLVISPVLREWSGYRWSGIHAWITEEAQAAGFEVIDPIESWRGLHQPEELRFYGDSLHYSARGNEVLAETIADAIR
jgi:lysophospholipase L1-like esterase